MLRKIVVGLLLSLTTPFIVYGDDVEVGVPVVADGVLQQIMRVDAGIDGICWYWVKSDPVNGTHCYRVEDSSEMPPLVPSSWDEISWEVCYGSMSEGGRHDGPDSIVEEAYLTDGVRFIIGSEGPDPWENAFCWFQWSSDYELVRNESVLYPE